MDGWMEGSTLPADHRTYLTSLLSNLPTSKVPIIARRMGVSCRSCICPIGMYASCYVIGKMPKVAHTHTHTKIILPGRPSPCLAWKSRQSACLPNPLPPLLTSSWEKSEEHCLRFFFVPWLPGRQTTPCLTFFFFFQNIQLFILSHFGKSFPPSTVGSEVRATRESSNDKYC